MKRYYYLFFVACFISSLLYSQDQKIIDQARIFFENEKYSAAQSFLSQLPNDKRTEESMYLDARCSKELYMGDAIQLYNNLNEIFPYNLYKNKIYEDIADIYYRDENYLRAIPYLEKVKGLSIENTFRLAYSNFNADSLEVAQYWFSKVMDTDSKYSKPAKYYYAYISYKKTLYNSALHNFLELEKDNKFGKIVPYYICQIFFYKEDYQNLISYAKPLSENLILERKEEIFRLLAEAYYRTGDYKNAITFFQKLQNEEKNIDPNLSFMLGHSFYNTGQYEYAILNLENVTFVSDSILQFAYYYLGASYIKFEYYNYALNAFKKSANYDNNKALQEDALFNYAKLSFQLNLPFDNTFNVFKAYLSSFDNSSNTAYIQSLMIKMFEFTNMYSELYVFLKDLDSLSIEQKKSLQRASFYLAIEEYNKQNFKKAILYFKESVKYPINDRFTYLSNFWLSDCFYNLSNFSQAIEFYNKLPMTSSQDLSSFQILKKYNLAYSYFKSKDYENSVKWYRSFLKVSKDSMKTNDCYLRLADSYFMLKKYNFAFKYYQKSISFDLFDIDYALYQSSVTASLVNNDIKQLNCLRDIVSNYQNSPYFLIAVKNLANYYKNTSNYEYANKYYNILIDSSTNRDWVADAYLSIGNMYLQIDSVDQAINQFLIVINNYGKTKYFKQALSSLQFAYSNLDRIDDYISLVESLPDYNITISEQDSLLYNSAYIKYIEKDYFLAKTSFVKYLNRFEKGIFHDKVLYYTAVSSMHLEDTLDAISYFEKVLSCNLSPNYKEKALVFLARYYFNENDYQKSNIFYLELYKMVSSNLVKREVITRLMLGYENIDLSKSVLFAEEVIGFEKVDNFLLSRAYLIIARSEFDSGNYAKSKNIFSKVKSYQIPDHTCEAIYHIAYLAYLDDSLKLAEELIFELVKNYSNKYFISRSLILLSDIYMDMNKKFQAKATLESVVENYKGLDLVEEARRKLEFIINQEKEEVIQQKTEQTFIEILEDDFEYKIQEIDGNYIVKDLKKDTISTESIKINLNILENEFD